jgi:Phage integrase, N-terminal SAM-like domain
MRGNITRRGKSSWRLKYDVGTGTERKIAYVTVRGTRKQAEAELAKRLNELAEGRYVARSLETLGSYANHWLTNIAPAKSGPSSLAQYETVIRTHILPELGPSSCKSSTQARLTGSTRSAASADSLRSH